MTGEIRSLIRRNGLDGHKDRPKLAILTGMTTMTADGDRENGRAPERALPSSRPENFFRVPTTLPHCDVQEDQAHVPNFRYPGSPERRTRVVNGPRFPGAGTAGPEVARPRTSNNISCACLPESETVRGTKKSRKAMEPPIVSAFSAGPARQRYDIHRGNLATAAERRGRAGWTNARVETFWLIDADVAGLCPGRRAPAGRLSVLSVESFLAVAVARTSFRWFPHPKCMFALVRWVGARCRHASIRCSRWLGAERAGGSLKAMAPQPTERKCEQ